MSFNFSLIGAVVVDPAAASFLCPHCEETIALPIGDAAFEACGRAPGHHYYTIKHGANEYQHICVGGKKGPRGGRSHGGEIKHVGGGGHGGHGHY